MDLQLPVQSVPITTKGVTLNPVRGEVDSDATLCDKVCQWLATGWWFSLGILVSSTNKIRPPWYNWNIVESGIKQLLNTKK